MNPVRLGLLLALTLLTHAVQAQGVVRLYNEAHEDYMADRFVQAEEKLKLVIKQEKIYPDAYFLYGQCEFQQKQYKKAIHWYDKALKQTPTNVEFVFHKALAYEDMGKVNKAVKHYLESTKIDPNYTMAWKRLGGIYFPAGNYEKAIDYYTHAVESQSTRQGGFHAARQFTTCPWQHARGRERLHPRLAARPRGCRCLFQPGECRDSARPCLRSDASIFHGDRPSSRRPRRLAESGIDPLGPRPSRRCPQRHGPCHIHRQHIWIELVEQGFPAL